MVRNLARTLQEDCGIELKVFGVTDSRLADDLASWAGIDVRSYEAIGPRRFQIAPRMMKALCAFRPDVIHAHGLWTFLSIVSLAVSRHLDIPRIVSPHGMLDSWALNHSHFPKRIALATYEGAHLRGARYVHALCQAEVQAIRISGITTRTCIVPNGVELPHVQGDHEEPSWRLLLPHGSKVLLYLGRIQEKKGLRTLLMAWAQAIVRSSDGRRWQLVIAGWDEGNYQLELEKIVNDLGIKETVHFVGPQLGRARDQSYASADAFVLPSLSEGLPVTVLEAWSWSLPVLMTDACNLPEGFTNNAAIRVKPTRESIESCLRSLFESDSVELKEIGRRGRSLVEARYTWGRIAKDFVSIYCGHVQQAELLY